jgi:pescadillo protein
MEALKEEYFDGLKAELKGVLPSSSTSNVDNQISAKVTEDREESGPDYEQIAKDKEEMELLLISKKKKGLYEAMKVNWLLLKYYLCCAVLHSIWPHSIVNLFIALKIF